jgi:exodeoxyribonuclease-5
MMLYTPSQQAALDLFDDFREDEDETVFALLGGPGMGKSFLTAHLIKDVRSANAPEVIVAAPTHKATNVVRRFLDANDLRWEQGYSRNFHNPRRMVTGTTAALLGISPVIVDDQSEEVKFGRQSGKGILAKFKPAWIFLDEVSMLPNPHFRDLVKICKQAGTKIVVIGDPAQLPPVKARPIPLHKARNSIELLENMRQGEDSKILDLAYAIRNNDADWRTIHGEGIRKVPDLSGAFLEEVENPVGLDEPDRAVAIAYRNVKVNALQDAACRKVYGHGMDEFRPGELVVSECSFYARQVLLCANQDELIVERIDEKADPSDPGKPVQIRRANRPGTIHAFYLAPDERRNPASPFNVELTARRKRALDIQSRFNDGDRRVDPERRAAWTSFFEWRDQTVISFRHPFAFTAHKSQGSTVRKAFVLASDLLRYSRAGMYVAVTRPREAVILG